MALGLPSGMAAGYCGGWLDRLVVRVADLLLAVPGSIVLLMVVAVLPGNDTAAMVTLGVIGCHVSHRVVVLHRGHLVETGTTADVCERPRHPHTQALLAAVPGGIQPSTLRRTSEWRSNEP